MSSYLFGDFFSEKADALRRKKARDELVKGGVNIFFDDEMNFVNDELLHMLRERPSNHNNVSFCLASVEERINCEDLLFPFGVYTQEELFPDGTEGSRDQFNQLSLENLNTLRDAIAKMFEVFEPKSFRLFVDEGFDTGGWKVCCCTREEMIQDIYRQVVDEGILDEKIYLLNG